MTRSEKRSVATYLSKMLHVPFGMAMNAVESKNFPKIIGLTTAGEDRVPTPADRTRFTAATNALARPAQRLPSQTAQASSTLGDCLRHSLRR